MRLNQLTIEQAKEGLKKKRFSSRELVEDCLKQIKTYDPQIKAFLTLNPSAIKQAQLADKDKTDKPLKGIPYALKDNFLTQGIKTTASAKLLDDFIPPYNATVYQRLSDAGAILLGKTNLDAWAHGSSTETSDYGPSHNPWNLNYLPGGSSGGSAAAVAADMVTFALGTETAGSIRQPASWCGITGLKPTYGRVSRYGIIAMASSTDSPGPLTKTAADAALVLQVIAGKDLNDATTASGKVKIDWKRIKSGSIKGLKIALPKEYLSSCICQSAKNLINQAVKVFDSLGAQVSQVSLFDPKYSVSVYTLVQRAEVASNLARYDGIRFGHDRSSFGHEAKNRIMLGTYSLSSRYMKEEQYYIQAQKVRALIKQNLEKLFSSFDLFIGPTTPGPALKLGATENDPMFGEMQDRLVEAAAVSGLTGISLPCGLIKGLPIGLQLTGPQFSEEKILHAGWAFQQATSWHLQKPSLNYA